MTMSIDFSPAFTAMGLRHQRTQVLHYAKHLTKDADVPEAVLVNAAVLNEWLLSAATRDDRRDRLQALEEADRNRAAERKPDDDPALLIAEADVYYAFLKGA